MNRIERKFEQLAKKKEKALVTFVTAGDPDLGTTEKLVLSMLESGADFVELGVPFSDPIAEGPVIQKASRRALDGGTTMGKIFGLVKRLREKTDEPLLFMMYLNTIYRFGTDRFFRLCAETGVDGVIVPDMPYEEREEIQGAADANGVFSIRLVAPTSHGRVKMIADGAKGFLYCVSSTGVTGTRGSFATNFGEFFGAIKKYAKIPCCVGFGISDPEQAKKMASYCDGAIVGSAIVKIVEREGTNAAPEVARFVRSLKDAIRGD